LTEIGAAKFLPSKNPDELAFAHLLGRFYRWRIDLLGFGRKAYGYGNHKKTAQQFNI
jgi:hypothetical protein